jgi:uncharacterized protein YoaH (UPF0181 family)
VFYYVNLVQALEISTIMAYGIGAGAAAAMVAGVLCE